VSRSCRGSRSRRAASAAAGLVITLAACTGSPWGGTDGEHRGERQEAALESAFQGFVRENGFEQLRQATVRLDGSGREVEIAAVIAETPEARARGLQGVADLPRGVGMLFLFPSQAGASEPIGFWMLGTLMDLDIAFSDGGTIIGVESMTRCPALPCPVTRPGAPFDTALEVGPGELSRLEVALGDRLSWTAR